MKSYEEISVCELKLLTTINCVGIREVQQITQLFCNNAAFMACS